MSNILLRLIDWIKVILRFLNKNKTYISITVVLLKILKNPIIRFFRTWVRLVTYLIGLFTGGISLYFTDPWYALALIFGIIGSIKEFIIEKYDIIIEKIISKLDPTYKIKEVENIAKKAIDHKIIRPSSEGIVDHQSIENYRTRSARVVSINNHSFDIDNPSQFNTLLIWIGISLVFSTVIYLVIHNYDDNGVVQEYFFKFTGLAALYNALKDY